MDTLETELEAYKSVRLRRAGMPQSHSTTVSMAPVTMTTPEGGNTPVYQRRSYVENKRWSTDSSASTGYLGALREVGHQVGGPFVWQMPFTLKCIGTFRYEWSNSSQCCFTNYRSTPEATKVRYGPWPHMVIDCSVAVAMGPSRCGTLLISGGVVSPPSPHTKQ